MRNTASNGVRASTELEQQADELLLELGRELTDRIGARSAILGLLMRVEARGRSKAIAHAREIVMREHGDVSRENDRLRKIAADPKVLPIGDARSFVPVVLEQPDGRVGQLGVGVVAIPLRGCGRCNLPMPMVPFVATSTSATTLAGSGWRMPSAVHDEKRRLLCVECQQFAGFVCAFCNEARTRRHVAIGSPAEIVCVECYETTPAKAFAERIEALEDEHRHDYD